MTRLKLLCVVIALFTLLLAWLPASASSPVPTFASARLLTARGRSACDEFELVSEGVLRWKGDLYTLQPPSSSLSSPLLEDDKTAKKEAKDAEKTAKKTDQLEPVGSPEFYAAVISAFLCVLIAALAAGLTVGLVSIDPFDLEVILETSLDDCETEEERAKLTADKRAAEKLLPVVRRHHLLLVTLLLLNSAANETLPLFLDAILPSWVAVLISVTLVLLFGEILPSALFTGSGQLALAARLVPVIWVCTALFAPIAWPIAKLLDCWLGDPSEEPDYFKRGELKALVKLQSSVALSASASSSTSSSAPSSPRGTRNDYQGPLSRPAARAVEEAGLTADEVTIITGALEMKAATVGSVCVPLTQVFMLSVDARLDKDTLASMLAVGHSRIPVYDGARHNITGLLLVKRLIVISPEDRRQISTLVLRRPLFVSPTLSAFECLNLFQRGSHLAVVCHDPQRAEDACKQGLPMPEDVGIVGIVTLEDLLERLIKEDIWDESDGTGVIRELEGVRVRKKRVAAFRKAAMRMRSSRDHPRSLTPTDLRVVQRIREERLKTGGSGRTSAGGRTSTEPSPAGRNANLGLSVDVLSSPLSAPLYGPQRHHSITMLPSPQSQLLGAEARDRYGSLDDNAAAASTSAVTKIGIRRWLRAAEKVVSQRAERGGMSGVQEEGPGGKHERDDPSDSSDSSERERLIYSSGTE